MIEIAIKAKRRDNAAGHTHVLGPRMLMQCVVEESGRGASGDSRAVQRPLVCQMCVYGMAGVGDTRCRLVSRDVGCKQRTVPMVIPFMRSKGGSGVLANCACILLLC